MKLSRLIAIGLIVSFSVMGMMTTPFKDLPNSDCPVFISKYRNSSIWEDARIRISIEAASACGGERPGSALELKNVELTIEAGNKRIARLYSSSGVISPRQGKFILGQTYGPIELGEIPSVATLLVDFNTHTVRSPSGVYLDFKEKTLSRY